MTDRRVVVVTGGGAGIGAAVAEELGRRGDHVVTVDPLVSLDGSERLPEPEETTVGRIVAGGGSAVASSLSVTDADGIRDLFESLVAEHGRLDTVVNVAGISRPTGFAKGSEADWRSVLEVHLDGYRNVLGAAIPIMAAAGRGRILGVTSGSGWRQADAGAYSCAKRAVAALTWQLAPELPPGVALNAMSPIAVTRMVTAALAAARPAGDAGGTRSSGGLSLGAMPEPEDIGPLAAHLVGDGFGWCRGQVVFAGGSELAVVDPPRLLEVVRHRGAGSVAHLLEAFAEGAWVAAEAAQGSGGGSNPRFPSLYDEPAAELVAAAVGSCAVAADDPGVRDALTRALAARGVETHVVDAASGFDGAATALAHAGPVDAVVVARRAGTPAAAGVEGWGRVLVEHEGVVAAIHGDAAWAHAAADHAGASGCQVRLVTLVDATTAGGRSRAQAATQLARAGARATEARVAAFAIGLEGGGADDVRAAAELAAHLACSPGATALAGAELGAGTGWFGLRSHPRPAGSITYGGPDVPPWLDDVLRQLVGAPAPQEAP